MGQITSKYVFNLLKPVEQPKTTWDEIYSWIIIQAKSVIIISLLIISFILVGKITVDTIGKNKLQELDNIKRELSFLELKENEIITLQSRLRNYAIIWGKSSNYNLVLNQIDDITSQFDDEINIQISGNTLSLNGLETLVNLQKFESDLKNSDLFSEVLTQNLSQNKQDIKRSIGRFAFLGIIKNLFIQRESLIDGN